MDECPHESLVSDDGSDQYYYCLSCRRTLRRVGLTGQTRLIVIDASEEEQKS